MIQTMLRVINMISALTGIFVLLLTTASTPNAYNGWNCAVNFAQIAMFGVLFAFSLELFPIKARGIGYAIVYTVHRVFTAVVRVQNFFKNSGDVLNTGIHCCIIC